MEILASSAWRNHASHVAPALLQSGTAGHLACEIYFSPRLTGGPSRGSAGRIRGWTATASTVVRKRQFTFLAGKPQLRASPPVLRHIAAIAQLGSATPYTDPTAVRRCARDATVTGIVDASGPVGAGDASDPPTPGRGLHRGIRIGDGRRGGCGNVRGSRCRAPAPPWRRLRSPAPRSSAVRHMRTGLRATKASP